MKKQKYFFILYFILFTVITIISIQVYWNIKNFKNSKAKITENIQITLDNTVDEFYIKRSMKLIEHFLKDSNFTHKPGVKIEKIQYNNNKKLHFNVKKISPKNSDSTFISKIEIKSGETSTNKLNKTLVALEKVNIKTNTIEIAQELAKKIEKKLKDKNLLKEGNILFLENKKPILNYNLNSKTNPKTNVTIQSKSKEISNNEQIQIRNIDINSLAFKESLVSILLSFLLSVTIIICLFILLRIINKQKQVDEIKNDFINNITHELKTPIAVVTSAIEGIQHFNSEKDEEKTKKYLSISAMQLTRLNNLVEKILETATLNSNQIILNKESVNLSDFVLKCIEKEKVSTNKNIEFTTNNSNITIPIDAFHFENVLNNMIQNAIKYGGNNIQISIIQKNNFTEIHVLDNGKAIEKIHQKKIFEKFYRIPTQNKHDVKGFGIGLYYVHQIIKSHNGTIEIIPNKTTHFKISLPNEN